MPKVVNFITVGFCDNGDADWHVKMSIDGLSFDEMTKLMVATSLAQHTAWKWWERAQRETGDK